MTYLNSLYVTRHLASFSTRGSMNMQTSPASTHVNLIGYKVVSGVFLRPSLVHCSFKEEILSTYELSHALSVLKTSHTHINNIRSWVFTTGGL